MGLLKDNGMRVEVVKESTLFEAKEKYSKLISEHLYSVHKSLENLELLADSNSGDVNYSAIKCDACKERNDDEMYLLRWGTAVSNITVENSVNSNSTDTINSAKTEKNSVKKNRVNALCNIKEKKAKNLEGSKTFIQKKDKESMKANKDTDRDENVIKKNKDARERNNTSIKDAEVIEEKENSIEKDKKSQKDTNLSKIENSKKTISKINSTTKKVSLKNSKKEGLDNFIKKLMSPPKSTENILSKERNDKTKEGTEKSKEQLDKNKKDKEKNLRGKKRNRSKETDNAAIKRKRIIIQSDSSDLEEQSDVEIEQVPPEELEPEISARSKSPSIPSVKHENGKKKILKLVNKTYKEGDYIVTKKERVYVSCSEDEEEKKEDEKKRQAKKVEFKQKMKKKQAILTDFFKKS